MLQFSQARGLMVDNPAAGGRGLGLGCDNGGRELLRPDDVAPRIGEVKRGVAPRQLHIHLRCTSLHEFQHCSVLRTTNE